MKLFIQLTLLRPTAILPALATLLILTACGNNGNNAIELQFSEQEAGVDPYKTRMIITDGFLRIDDGAEGKDFILFDRKTRKISSVAFENERIFEITPHETKLETPENLNWEHQEMEAKDAPSINNIQPTGHSFKVNQQTCLQTMSAKGLLEKARLALVEYQSVLAGEHAANFEKTPKSQRQPCNMALNIFHATDSLKYGFPIIEWDSAGHRRQLDNYTENVPVNADLFKLPEDFSAFSIN